MHLSAQARVAWVVEIKWENLIPAMEHVRGAKLGFLLEEELAAASTAAGGGYLPGAGTAVSTAVW